MRHHIEILCGRLWYQGSDIVAMSGRIGASNCPREGHLRKVEEAAREILAAVEAYRAAVALDNQPPASAALCGGTLPVARFDEIQGKGEEAA